MVFSHVYPDYSIMMLYYSALELDNWVFFVFLEVTSKDSSHALVVPYHHAVLHLELSLAHI